MDGLTAPRIGFSTLSLLLAGTAGPYGPEMVSKFARDNGMGYQLVMQRYWTAQLLDPSIELCIAMEKLFIHEGFMRPYFDPLDDASANYTTISGLYPCLKTITYEPEPNSFVHATSLLGATPCEVLENWFEGKCYGFVVDTNHSMYRNSDRPRLFQHPFQFHRFVERCLVENIPLIFHLQPSRIPDGGTMFVVHNLYEIMQFIRGVKGNRLSNLLLAIKGSEVPVVIELDPKFWYLNYWLILKMKESVERDLGL